MRNEVEKNKAYYYTLAGVFVVTFLYLGISAINLFQADAQKGAPKDPGALRETVSIEQRLM